LSLMLLVLPGPILALKSALEDAPYPKSDAPNCRSCLEYAEREIFSRRRNLLITMI
jgi:hypothetical protein